MMDTIRVCCLSDLHGYLPEVPDCDLLLLAGDYVPLGKHDDRAAAQWFDSMFRPWLADIAKRTTVIGVAGNHDFIFEGWKYGMLPPLDWTYLKDSGATFRNLNVYGSPYSTLFGNWAFMERESLLGLRWNRIPDDTDILVLHGPPYGYGDLSSFGGRHCGSPSLLNRIQDISPRLVVAGHIHEGRGWYRILNRVGAEDTLFVNAAYVDEAYNPAGEPIVVEIKV